MTLTTEQLREDWQGHLRTSILCSQWCTNETVVDDHVVDARLVDDWSSSGVRPRISNTD